MQKRNNSTQDYLYVSITNEITLKTVIDDSDRATKRLDYPLDNSRGYSASLIPNPRTSPLVLISGRILYRRRCLPLSNFVDLVVDSSTQVVNYLHCEPSGTISTLNRAVLKIPAKSGTALQRGLGIPLVSKLPFSLASLVGDLHAFSCPWRQMLYFVLHPCEGHLQ